MVMIQGRDALIQEIRTRYYAGESKRSICTSLSVSSRTVNRWLPNLHQERIDLIDEAIRQSFENGETLQSMADRFGMSRDSIHGRRTQVGIENRKRKVSEAKRLEMARRYLEGESPLSIARDLRVCRDTVEIHLRQMGVHRKKEPPIWNISILGITPTKRMKRRESDKTALNHALEIMQTREI